MPACLTRQSPNLKVVTGPLRLLSSGCGDSVGGLRQRERVAEGLSEAGVPARRVVTTREVAGGACRAAKVNEPPLRQRAAVGQAAAGGPADAIRLRGAKPESRRRGSLCGGDVTLERRVGGARKTGSPRSCPRTSPSAGAGTAAGKRANTSVPRRRRRRVRRPGFNEGRPVSDVASARCVASPKCPCSRRERSGRRMVHPGTNDASGRGHGAVRVEVRPPVPRTSRAPTRR